MSGIDLSKLSGLQALVKSQTTSDAMEKSVFRTGADMKEVDDLLRRSSVSCNPTARHNVFQNVMGFSTKRDRYLPDC